MKSIVITCLFVAATALAAAAQTTAPATSERTYPYAGVVIRDGEAVRGAPKENDIYECARVPAGTKVTVVGEVPADTKPATWLKIRAAAGCFSIVHANLIEPDADGRTGQAKDVAMVRASGVLSDPNRITVWQDSLAAGEKVNILGKLGDYYKIDPPRPVVFYIRAAAVAPDKALGAGRPAGQDTAPDAATTEPKATPVPPVAPPSMEEQVKALEELEKAFKAEFAKPLDERNFDAMLARYVALVVSADSPVALYRNHRIRFLTFAIVRRAEHQKVAQLVKQALNVQKEIEIKRTGQVLERTRAVIKTYDAIGVLSTSALFSGRTAGPKRYLLRDAKTRNLVAYVQPANASVDVESYLGKFVGVYGDKRRNYKLGADIVIAQQVTDLNKPIEITKSPRPTVKFAPKPEPTTTPAPQPTTKGEATTQIDTE